MSNRNPSTQIEGGRRIRRSSRPDWATHELKGGIIGK